MRSRLMFHTFVALMLTLLIFSISSGTRAQQNSERTEVPEIAAAQDIRAVSLAAKAAAERDANSDINKLLWFGSGLGGAAVGGGIGACSGCLVGLATNPPESDPVICWLPNVNVEGVLNSTTVGLGLGGIVGTFVPLIGIYNYRSNPSPKQLIGKSAEYVEAYTDAYVRKARAIRTLSAVAGAAIGCGLALLFVVGG